MKNFSIASLVLFLILSCDFNSENIQNNVELNTILENYYQDGLKLNPINATNEGDSRYNDKFPELITDDYKKRQAEYYNKYLNKVSTFEINGLAACLDQ